MVLPQEYVTNATEFAKEQAGFAEEDKPDWLRRGPLNTTKVQKRNLFIFNTAFKTLMYESWKPVKRGRYHFNGTKSNHYVITVVQNSRNIVYDYVQGSKSL